MDRRRKAAVGAVFALGVIGLGTGIAIAGSGEDEPLTGSVLEQATAAALAHTGGGTVTETEIGEDGASYSVEVRLDDGSQVEVELDERFSVLGQEADDDAAGGSNDDDRP